MAEDGGSFFGEGAGGIGGWGFFGGFAIGGDGEDLLEAGEVGFATAFELGFGEGFFQDCGWCLACR